MGSPLSAILLEIFLQCIKCNSTVQIGGKHKLLVYFRYLDDIMIIYDHKFADILFYSTLTKSDNNYNLHWNLKIIKFLIF